MFSKNARQLSSYIPKSRLEGKIAVVTASTDGIGLAIAKRLAQEGAKVVISSRKQANVDKALSKLAADGLRNSIVGTVCHVNKAEDRKRIFDEAKKLGGLDILVSNAGTNPEVGPLLECSENAWDKTFETNLKAAFMLAKEALPLLRERGGGRIMFISSIAAFAPVSLLGVYSVTKTALLGLTKVAAQDLAPENITVNCVAPGIINTKFSSMLTQEGPIQEEAMRNIPMNRFGEVDEVAGVVTFLASDDSKYITGETIVVSGGMQSHL
ncbi:hypothetical protein RN001_009168 [Aquatica leii]|uniref:Dehydrogenase/reductase SDR family member 4 n=1 Tax=Aquatica leii TaxID=1421715 RepID=A0AAN7SDP1_9COLE|nr:hypothetical protein RN001_009168 [Aquatica leii]